MRSPAKIAGGALFFVIVELIITRGGTNFD